MSCRIEYYNINEKLGQALYLLQCGLTVCDPGHRYGPVSYENYAIHFVVAGVCHYAVEGKEYSLSAGEGFLIHPHQQNTYWSDEKQPCTFLYMIFNGEDADRLARLTGLDRRTVTFQFPREDGYFSNLHAMHRAAGQNKAGLDCMGRFLLALSPLMHQKRVVEREKLPKQYVGAACAFVKEHYAYHLSTEDIARHVGLERSYLYRLFKTELGLSPRAYILEVRLEKAAQMLREGNMTFTVIALSCGFCDFSHFSKRFTEKYGLTPGEFRRNIKEDAL